MGTRLRLAGTAAGAPVSPAFQSYTHASSLAQPRRGMFISDTSSPSNGTCTPDGADHLVAGDTHFTQNISDPMLPGIAFDTGDTVKYAMQASQAHANNNLFLQLWVGVYSQDGSTLQATLRSKVADDTELATSLTNRTSSHNLDGSYTTVSGDRLVVEISMVGTPGPAAGGTQGHNGTLRFGSTGSSGDLPENDTETGTTFNAWIEFSRDIVFLNKPYVVMAPLRGYR